MRTTRLKLGLALVLVGLGGVACGLFPSDLLTFAFQLPSKSVTVSADGLVPGGWATEVTVPAVPCPPIDCCTLATAAGEECATFGLACAAGSCAATPQVVLVNAVNLAQEAPELQSVASNVSSFATVTLKRIYLSQYQNGLNVPTPAIEVWIGPEAATGVDDQDAQGAPLCSVIGTLDPIPAQSSKPSCTPGVDCMEVRLTPDGAALFERFAKEFRQTFKVFVRVTVSITAGTPVPQGTFNATITGEISAAL